MLYTNYYGCCKRLQTTIKNCKVPHLKSTDVNRIEVTMLTCWNIQVKQHYGTMLATATGKLTMRINIMSSRELFFSCLQCTCADASDYARSLLCATLLLVP